MRVKIYLDDYNQVKEFCQVVTGVVPPDIKVWVKDDSGACVDARSFLGMSYGKAEFHDMWCECEKDISGSILKFIL